MGLLVRHEANDRGGRTVTGGTSSWCLRAASAKNLLTLHCRIAINVSKLIVWLKQDMFRQAGKIAVFLSYLSIGQIVPLRTTAEVERRDAACSFLNTNWSVFTISTGSERCETGTRFGPLAPTAFTSDARNSCLPQKFRPDRPSPRCFQQKEVL
jgi:hypothetical protein